MRVQHFAVVSFLCCAMSLCALGQEGASINWESYKDIEFEFEDSLLRVDPIHEMFTFATGASTEWSTSDPNREPIEITQPISTGFQSINASSVRATASAVTGWYLDMDEFAGHAHLANSAAGTTAIDDKFDPTVVAMSWASHTTNVEFGQEVSQGSIDWTPGISVGTGGGAFVSSHDMISIHDPIVVWTRGSDGQLREPTTVFEVFAEFDSETQFHWNQIRRIGEGVDGPALVIVPNDGPFLDAGMQGTGRFTLSLQSELLPESQRGAVTIAFENGIVTESIATGRFQNIEPVDAGPVPVLSVLPAVGMPARIESLLPTEDAAEQFNLALNVGADAVISNLAACSDGIHVSVGPAIDTIQTFTVNPTQREAVSPRVSLTADGVVGGILPNACLGPIREDADLLFGTTYRTRGNVTLHQDDQASPIDRVLRLNSTTESPRQVVLFEPGEQEDTNNIHQWTAMFDVRSSVWSQDDVQSISDQVVRRVDDVVSSTEESSSSFTVGLLDASRSDDGSATDVDVSRLFSRNADGFLVNVADEGGASLVQLIHDGQVIGEKILEPDSVLADEASAEQNWRQFELSLLQQDDGVRVNLQRMHPNGRTIEHIVQRTVPGLKLSETGYQLAAATERDVDPSVDRSSDDGIVYDFDNFTTTTRDRGDLAWDGIVDVADFERMENAIEVEADSPLFDVNLDGEIDLFDLEAVEDLILNKIPGDTDFDGHVTFGDFLVLSKNYGTETGLWSLGDFDSNGEVDFPDFLVLSKNFERGPATDEPTTSAVPEPNGLLLLSIALLGLGRIRARSKSRTSELG